MHIDVIDASRREDDGGWDVPGRPRASRSVRGRHLGGHGVARGGGWWAQLPAGAKASVRSRVREARAVQMTNGVINSTFDQLHKSSFHKLLCPYCSNYGDEITFLTPF
jgi:hypothetical protein